MRPEAKFLNGEYCDRGRTERRHVVAAQILHIGKEANKWEEQYFLGEDDDAEIEYGVDLSADDLDVRLRELCREVGEREAAQKLGISRTALRRALKLGVEAMSRAMLSRLGLKAFMSVQSKVQALIEDDPDRAIWEAENTEKADCRLGRLH